MNGTEKQKEKKAVAINFYNIDCVEFMKTKPDNCYDLAIVDPPYGNVAVFDNCQPKERKNERPKKYKTKDWDNTKPNAEYWKELFRVSKNQIVWGGNYFTDFLPESRGWIYWDKKTGDNNFSDGELAWTSFHKRLMSYSINSKADTRGGKDRFHPTQKPIRLYRWTLQNYAEQGWKILDTNGGSMGIAIACSEEGFDLDICEIDKEYFNKGLEKYNEYMKQPKLF
jgi:site-specific DNA-methyltransferase (adenine-specific)